MIQMKSGKAAPALLERSVFRPLHLAGAAGEDVAFGSDGWILPAGHADTSCTVTNESGGSGWYGSTVTSVVGDPLDPSLWNLLYGIENNLAVCGAKWTRLVVCLVWPAAGRERYLSEMMRQISSFCAQRGVQVWGGDTQISSEVSRPVVTLTGYGQVQWQAKQPDSNAGRRIWMAGFAGEAGTAIVANACRDELLTRFPERLVHLALEARPDIARAAFASQESGCCALHDVSRGGVFAALWELGEKLGCGFDVYLRKLPVRQETIEVCEYFDLNPCQLYGQGALLLVTGAADEEDDRALPAKLQEAGYPAAEIGICTDSRARRILRGEEIRYLEKPAQDMLEVLKNRRNAHATGH
ncbi:MAG: hypothetical protein IJI24_00275 [Lachnospiraceae bacterium]|nr:hypothetical protein [Lachnospiraceae bacterium]